MTASDITIERYAVACDLKQANEMIDDIFFQSSSIKHFASPAERAAFRWRWLGRYLEEETAHAFVAVWKKSKIVGYVVGALDDPAGDSRYAELAYFKDFAPWTARFPSHLHINLDAQYRSAGTGARLVDAFCSHAAELGSPGVHIVTGNGLRNVGFYARNGFTVLVEAPWKSGHVVMMGRPTGGAGRSAAEGGPAS